MARKWVEVASSPAYQALAPEQQEEARSQYWNEVIAPQVPEQERATVRQQFDADTTPTVNWPGADSMKIEVTGGRVGPADIGQSGVTREQRQKGIAAADEALDLDSRRSSLDTQESIGRNMALGGRAMLRGVVGLPDMVVSPLVAGVNRLLPERYQQTDLTGMVDSLADRVGAPRPANAAERVSNDVTSAIAGAGVGLGVGNALARLGVRGVQSGGSNMLTSIGSTLSAQPTQQLLAAGAGTAAGSATRESGGGAGAQLAASLAAGIGPNALATLGAASARGLVRGTSGAQMQRTIDDFNSLGASPSVAQASGNRALQGIENLLAGAPTSTGVMTRFAERQANDVGDGLRAMGDKLSRNASGERAGLAIERGINGPDGFTEKFKSTQKSLFNKLDELIPSDTGISIENTSRAIKDLNAPISGAPNTSKFFQNAKVAGIGNALEKDLSLPTSESLKLEDALERLDRVYASRDAATQDAGRFSAFANNQENAANRYFPVEGMPRFPGRYTPPAQQAKLGTQAASEATDVSRRRVAQAREIEETIGQLQAAADAANGRLPYEAIKKLRTLVGQELDDAGIMSEFPRSKFKALYAALSSDLGAAAMEAGPEAARAYTRANNYTRVGMGRVEQISRVIDKNGGPEQVFQAAMAGTRDGGTTLRAVMQSLPKDGQKAITSAVIKRMGLATPGAQDAAGDVFSAATFLTNWNKVSPEAKRALFDRYGAGFSQNIDRVAQVASNIKQGAKIYANPSGTANRAAALTYGGGLVASLFDPSLITTGSLVAGGIGANLSARLLTNPRVVAALAQTTKLPQGAIIGHLQAMRQAAERTGDEDLALAADALDKARDQESSSANGGNAQR